MDRYKYKRAGSCLNAGKWKGKWYRRVVSSYVLEINLGIDE